MNLKALDQTLELHRHEAEALRDALSMYQRLLAWRSGERPLYLAETMSLRPMTRVHEQLCRLLAGTWPRTPRKVLKARRWRVGFDELVQLNVLLVAGELFAADSSMRPGLGSVYLKINQKALNLQAHFRLEPG